MTFKQIRESRFTKVVASYLAMQLLLQFTGGGAKMFALTGGPTQPEFESFTPIGTSDMVNLSSGNFNYNIPLMDVGGYPLNLSYDSGQTMDSEASWVGLGWNMNAGQINRQVRGLPDDFKGDQVTYENEMRKNTTVGVNLSVKPGFAGFEFIGSIGLGVQYNSYEGVSWQPSLGLSFGLSENVAVGFDITGNTTGPSVSPSVSFSKKLNGKKTKDQTLNVSYGLGLSSRKGLESMTLSSSVTKKKVTYAMRKKFKAGQSIFKQRTFTKSLGSYSRTLLSFNDVTYMPTKRAGMKSLNGTLNIGFGGETFFAELQAKINAYMSVSDIDDNERHKLVPAFGYDYTEHNYGKSDGVLDFNRENDRHFNHLTTALPVANYTYDIYNMDGQGVGGTFRPYRSQVSYLYDTKVSDHGAGGSLGFEVGAGSLVHAGFDVKVSPSFASVREWKNYNYARDKFKESPNDNKPFKEYEPVYFRLSGEGGVDRDQGLYEDDLHGENPYKIMVGGKKYDRKLLPNKQVVGPTPNKAIPIKNKYIRSKRDLRNQSIYKVTQEEAKRDPFVKQRDGVAKDHHTVGLKLLQPEGKTYVYGESLYNFSKVSATFDVSARSGNCETGLVDYNGNVKGNHNNSSDKYLNRITTPAYASSYLLSSVHSSDYSDVTGNGCSDDDLGWFAKFSYVEKHGKDNPYHWRVPFQKHKAGFNEGLKTTPYDQKGNILYGTKETKYLDKIETKTHIALFDISPRNDAYGVNAADNERGSEIKKATDSKSYKLDKVYLFAKSEFYAAKPMGKIWEDLTTVEKAELAKHAIKVAHLEYDYSLCKGVVNNDQAAGNGQTGKLTLKKVYFTYRNSNMGKYAPYTFDYGQFDANNNGVFDDVAAEKINKDYHIKGYDIWGNYKPVANSCGLDEEPSNEEFPYVKQDKKSADEYAVNWNLTTIGLPAGGKMEVNYETDDYSHVQDKKAMQMFNVTGAGTTALTSSSSSLKTKLYSKELYSSGLAHRYLYVKLSNDLSANITTENFKEKFLGEHLDKPMYFRFLLNMTKKGHHYDFVEGFCGLMKSWDMPIIKLNDGSQESGIYVSLPLDFIRMGGGIEADSQENPIAKAGWHFGRKHLNRAVYGLGGSSSNKNFKAIVQDLGSSLKSVLELYKGPNLVLKQNHCAKNFKAKSWVRLQKPDGRKYGGGERVKRVRIFDNWDEMTNQKAEEQHYGQEYYYNVKGVAKDTNAGDGIDDLSLTSGVATYEPNASKENPLVNPFYGGHASSYADIINSPREDNYSLTPFGEGFFPTPTVTYGTVMVKSLERKRIDENQKERTITKHANGKTVTEFYTSKDFPTKVSFTELTKFNDKPNESIFKVIANMLFTHNRHHLTMSQGFSIVTNDMNGKQKKVAVYPEGEDKPISWEETKFTASNGVVNNHLMTVDEEGNVKKQELGVNYDVINDFRENYSENYTAGANLNFALAIFGIVPATNFLSLPTYNYHQNILRTAVVTKVVNKMGLPLSNTVYNDGATSTTENVAWDAKSGNVLVTKTKNEYEDAYYSMNFPVYWAKSYSGMGMASQNIGFEGAFKNAPTSNLSTSSYQLIGFENGDLSEIFHLGDELFIKEPNSVIKERYWVAAFSSDKKSMTLIDRAGRVLSTCASEAIAAKFKIVRSGHRNMHMNPMAAITSMVNPIKKNPNYNPNDENNKNEYVKINEATFDYVAGNPVNPRVVTASAVTYKDFWPSQYDGVYMMIPSNGTGVNPFVRNIRGNWRAVRSYAYLTGRSNSVASDGLASTRREGYLTDFKTFYEFKDGTWKMRSDAEQNWTFASEISKFTPQGLEVENKDALGRYSAAQFSYNNTLAEAVASNSEYREMGFTGFEYGPASSSHFGIGGSVASDESHTGKNSLKVGKVTQGTNVTAASATMKWSLEDCNVTVIDNSCPEKYPCVSVTGGAKTLNDYGCNSDGGCARLRTREVILKGAPFQRVCYGFGYRIAINDSGNNEGYVKLYLNGSEIASKSTNSVAMQAYGNSNLFPMWVNDDAIDQVITLPVSGLENSDRYVVLDENGDAKFKIEVYVPSTTSRNMASASLIFETYPQNTKDVKGTAVLTHHRKF